jgi:hypothetical protein
VLEIYQQAGYLKFTVKIAKRVGTKQSKRVVHRLVIGSLDEENQSVLENP